MPLERKTTLKIANKRAVTDMKSANVVSQAMTRKFQAMLVNEVKTNTLMEELCGSEMLIIVMSSVTLQNLERVMRSLKDKMKLLYGDHMPLVYNSSNKVQAFEDCITYSP